MSLHDNNIPPQTLFLIINLPILRSRRSFQHGSDRSLAILSLAMGLGFGGFRVTIGALIIRIGFCRPLYYK